MRPTRAIVIVSLAAVLLLSAVTIYLFTISPNQSYYQVRMGLVKGKPFRLHGRVIDQYGRPVERYEMILHPFFEKREASYWRSKVKPFETVTNKQGKFSFDTSPVKLVGLFYGARKPLFCIDGVWYHGTPSSGGDIFYLRRGSWIRDGRWETPNGSLLMAPHDPSEEYVFRVGRSGPPERMIEFRGEVRDIPITDDCRSRISVVTEHAETPDCPDCDFELQVLKAKTAAKTDGMSFTAKVVGLNGATLQVARDPFLREAPPDGYTNEVVLESLPCQLKSGWLPPITKWLYFKARDGQVYGKMLVDAGPFDQGRRLGRSITVVANPRSSRNLNDGDSAHYCESLALPVTLPFKEDNPLADGRRIWVFVDHTRDARLIVKGKEGSVEPGCSVQVVNRSYLGHGRPPSDIIDIVTVESQKDGSFEASVTGKEGDPIGIHVVRRRAGMPTAKSSLYLEHSWQDQTSFLPTTVP